MSVTSTPANILRGFGATNGSSRSSTTITRPTPPAWTRIARTSRSSTAGAGARPVPLAGRQKSQPAPRPEPELLAHRSLSRSLRRGAAPDPDRVPAPEPQRSPAPDRNSAPPSPSPNRSLSPLDPRGPAGDRELPGRSIPEAVAQPPSTPYAHSSTGRLEEDTAEDEVNPAPWRGRRTVKNLEDSLASSRPRHRSAISPPRYSIENRLLLNAQLETHAGREGLLHPPDRLRVSSSLGQVPDMNTSFALTEDGNPRYQAGHVNWGSPSTSPKRTSTRQLLSRHQ